MVEEKKREGGYLREVQPRSFGHHLPEGELDPVLLDKSRSVRFDPRTENDAVVLNNTLREAIV